MASVSVRTDKDTRPIRIEIEPGEMRRLAKHWHYLLRSRRRWIADQKLWPRIESRAVADLKTMGIDKAQLEKIAAGSLAEVLIDHGPIEPESPPDLNSDPDWEARVMPWEYLLTAGTSKYRDEPLVVIRYLNARNAPKASAGGREKRIAAFLQSEPGELRGRYTFDIEKRALKNYLDDDVVWKEFTANSSPEEMRAFVQSDAPNLVHVSGFDNFQGTLLLKMDTSVTDINDGMFLKNVAGQAFPCPAIVVADSLTAADSKPEVVSFNMYNSSARLAAFSVGRGAAAAIGFQDFVDDRLAEIFFANFYLNWRQCQWRVLDAYQETMSGLREYKNKLQGTGIVLWTRESLLELRQSPCPKPQLPQPIAASPDWIEFSIKPLKTLNYSILHNSRTPLFEKFSVYKFKPLQQPEIDIEVELQIGSDRFPFRHSFRMRDHALELSDEIAVGLTSELVRSLREGVRATLFVLVRSGQQRLFYRTFRITLLAVDEWRDDDFNRKWLPSFVLPRDRAVLQIIIAAQRYLRTIRDDNFAGFDGYQGGKVEKVNSQVKAIWHALVHDFHLSYINPPPTFTFSSQRLRTPDEIIRGGRGTCIDLALLIAACLEFVNIRPVVFLTDGHAFPGYWTSQTCRDAFLVSETRDESPSAATEAFVQEFPWEFTRTRYSEILDAVRRRHLIPLESTLLTKAGGFRRAIKAGNKKLQDEAIFNSMLEIGLARDDDVTPLPLAAEAERWPAKA